MIGFIIFSGSLGTGLGVWLLGIRPYLSHHRGVVVTGASWGVSAWADWQQCRDLGQAKSDPKALALCRYFVLAQVGCVAGIILILCRI